MTKLCPRGKAAGSENLKCTRQHMLMPTLVKFVQEKIKDPSGKKRKDFRGPKPAGKGGMAEL